MDEKMLASIEASKMLGTSEEILKNDSYDCFYIPLIDLRNCKVKSKDWLQEEDRMFVKIQAVNMLGSCAFSQDGAQKCTYIPLIDLRNRKIRKDCVREFKGSIENFNFFFDYDKHIGYLSETCSTLPKISVNSSEKRDSQSDSQKNETVSGFHAINGFLPPVHHAKHQKVSVKEWLPDDYASAEKEIYAGMKYSYRRSLIVWCPTSDIESELVHVWLKKSGNPVFIYDRWIHKDVPNATGAWGGVIAIYPDRTAAKEAEKEIPLQHETLKAIRLSKVIQCFVKSELKYFSGVKTKVLVHAKVLNKENIQKIEAILYRFGQVEFCTYDYLIRNAAVDFEVTYAFATHAFLAKAVLDNLPFGSGLLDVEVKMTPKMKAILYDFRSQLKEMIGKEYFPL